MTPSSLQLVAFNQFCRDNWVASMAESLPPGTRILDVGAGECRYRELFRHCKYETHDSCQYEGTKEGSLKEDWTYHEIDYVSDILSIPVPDNHFDALLCTEVLEHVPEPIRALKEFARIIKTGGRLFITAPLGSGLHQQPFHFYGGFTPHFYERFLAEYGFEVVSINSNGNFFRFLLQEVHRGVDIIRSTFQYKRWHPLHWILKLIAGEFVAKWLTRLDEEIPIEEFTVGYHIEARKL